MNFQGVNSVSVDWIEFTLFSFPVNPTAIPEKPKKSALDLWLDRVRKIQDMGDTALNAWTEEKINAVVSDRLENAADESTETKWTPDMMPELLQVPNLDLAECPRGNLGYLKQHTLAGARIYSQGSPGMGLHVSIGGEAIQSSGFDAWAMLRRLWLAGAKFTRIDLAVDDFKGLLDLPKMMQACRKGHCNSNLREWQIIESGTNSTGEVTGRTLYQGSRESEFYARFYDKRLLSIKQGKAKRELPKHWIRAESEIKGTAANKIAAWAAAGADLAKTALGLLANYISFKTPSKTDTKKSRWKVAQWWLDFVGDTKLTLAEKKTEPTMDRREKWFNRQCARTFAMLLHANGADKMQETYTTGKATIKPGQWKEIDQILTQKREEKAQILALGNGES